MRSIEIPYALYRGVYHPIIPIRLLYKAEWFDFWAYVDSGATYSLFAAQEAIRMGLDIRHAPQRYIIVGDGGFIPASFVKLPMLVGNVELDVEIGFSDRLGIGFNLLGRKDVFEKFRVYFNDSKKVVSFHQNDEQS